MDSMASNSGDGNSGDGNRKDKGKGKRAFNYMRDVIFKIGRKTGESSQQVNSGVDNTVAQPHADQPPVIDHAQLERQRHEGMHKRISALLGMDDNEHRQYLWRLIKNDENNDIAEYMTSEIQEYMRQHRDRIDDQQAQMMDEFDNGNLEGGIMNERINELALEYDQQQMLYVLEEINRRINQ